MSDLWDDPEWEALRRRVNGQQPRKKKKPRHDRPKPTKPAAESVVASEEPKKVEVNVKFTVPKIDLNKLPKPSQKQIRLGAIGAATLLGVIVIGTLIFKGVKKNPDGQTPKGTNATQKADFDSILPDGNEKQVEGDIRYDSTKKVVSYRDVIGLVNVTVSQQKLPESFNKNPDEEVKKVAEGFSANEILRETNPRIYMGQDVKGPQTIIFHKDGVLVFMLSPRPLEKHEWVEYILKLK